MPSLATATRRRAVRAVGAEGRQGARHVGWQRPCRVWQRRGSPWLNASNMNHVPGESGLPAREIEDGRGEGRGDDGTQLARGAGGRRRELAVSISFRTILLAGVAVAVAAALASIRSVLLRLFVSMFSIAVFSPVVDGNGAAAPWSRRLCATLLVLAIVIVIGGVVLVLLGAVVDGVANLQRGPAGAG